MVVRNQTPRNAANTASAIAATVSTTKAMRSPPGTGPENALTTGMIPSPPAGGSRGSPIVGAHTTPLIRAAAAVSAAVCRPVRRNSGRCSGPVRWSASGAGLASGSSPAASPPSVAGSRCTIRADFTEPPLHCVPAG